MLRPLPRSQPSTIRVPLAKSAQKIVLLATCPSLGIRECIIPSPITTFASCGEVIPIPTELTHGVAQVTFLGSSAGELVEMAYASSQLQLNLNQFTLPRAVVPLAGALNTTYKS